MEATYYLAEPQPIAGAAHVEPFLQGLRVHIELDSTGKPLVELSIFTSSEIENFDTTIILELSSTGWKRLWQRLVQDFSATYSPSKVVEIKLEILTFLADYTYSMMCCIEAEVNEYLWDNDEDVELVEEPETEYPHNRFRLSSSRKRFKM